MREIERERETYVPAETPGVSEEVREDGTVY